MLVIVSLAVALVAFILYALDRKSKGEPIAWDSALKLSTFSGIITSGVIFAIGSDATATTATTAATAATAVVDSVLPAVDSIQSVVEDMFVGTPSF